jgi:hypothetical protein
MKTTNISLNLTDPDTNRDYKVLLERRAYEDYPTTTYIRFGDSFGVSLDDEGIEALILHLTALKEAEAVELRMSELLAYDETNVSKAEAFLSEEFPLESLVLAEDEEEPSEEELGITREESLARAIHELRNDWFQEDYFGELFNQIKANSYHQLSEIALINYGLTKEEFTTFWTNLSEVERVFLQETASHARTYLREERLAEKAALEGF